MCKQFKMISGENSRILRIGISNSMEIRHSNLLQNRLVGRCVNQVKLNTVSWCNGNPTIWQQQFTQDEWVTSAISKAAIKSSMEWQTNGWILITQDNSAQTVTKILLQSNNSFMNILRRFDTQHECYLIIYFDFAWPWFLASASFWLLNNCAKNLISF